MLYKTCTVKVAEYTVHTVSTALCLRGSTHSANRPPKLPAAVFRCQSTTGQKNNCKSRSATMSSLPVRARRIFQAQLSRSCKSCQRATPRRPSIPFPKAAPNPTTQARIAGRRYATTSTTPPGGSQTGSASSRSATGEQAMRRREAYYAPSMETMQAYYRRKNLTVM